MIQENCHTHAITLKNEQNGIPQTNNDEKQIFMLVNYTMYIF